MDSHTWNVSQLQAYPDRPTTGFAVEEPAERTDHQDKRGSFGLVSVLELERQKIENAITWILSK